MAGALKQHILKLHVKMTVLISIVILAVLLAVTYIYNSRVRAINAQDQKDRAEIAAVNLADGISQKGLINNNSDLSYHVHTFVRGGVQQVRVYGIARGEPVEVVTDPPTDREPVPPQALAQIKNSNAYAQVTQLPDGNVLVNAYAPITTQKDGLIGLVAIRIRPTQTSVLQRSSTTITTLLLIAIVLVTLLNYLFFRRIIYRPIDELLSSMTRAQAGDLTATAPITSDDEIGHLAAGYNKMLARAREMTEERERHNILLQDQVSVATLEIAERNEQLESANLELFKIQHQLSQYERFAVAGQLTAQFAHEVGTPLNLISGHVQLLRAKVDDEKTQQRLDVITAQIDRITRIVRGMLDTTRRPKAVMSRLNLNALLQRTFEAAAPTLASNNVSLVTDFAPDLPDTMGDAEQLQQVFINLLNNSLDAMPDGGILTIKTSPSPGAIVIECSDTGQGISPDVQAHLFEPLFSTKPLGKGTGLGLAITKQIITEHGGQIEVCSTPGSGTTMIIGLPAEELVEEHTYEETETVA
ncbi:MAG TPA: ATP-binding protein [Blastocatellia bacterium]|nr:ATP-binding protein [Blastocatellia bacterium]